MLTYLFYLNVPTTKQNEKVNFHQYLQAMRYERNKITSTSVVRPEPKSFQQL